MLYTADQIGGPSQIRSFDTAGKPQGAVPILQVSSVDQLVGLNDGALLFRNTSFLEPPAWYRYDPVSKMVTRTALRQTAATDFNDAEVVREFATSKDGTRIPVNIIRRKGTKLDGKNPVLLTGHGGYGISEVPDF